MQNLKYKISITLWVCVVLPLVGWAAPINTLLKEAGVRKGLIVHIGPAVTTKALGQASRALVHGLVRDNAAVVSARALLKEADLSGRVNVSVYDGGPLPFVDNCVNAVVILDSRCSILDAPSSPEGFAVAREIERVLTPGGVAIVPKESSIPYPVSSIGDGFVKFTKPVPDDIDGWSHFMHGPNNNAVAADTRVGPPGGLQWVADPKWNRDHDMLPGVFSVISGNGRLFYMLDEGPAGVVLEDFPRQFFLHARDAFNGTSLWKRKMEKWYLPRTTWGHLPVTSHRRLVADGDSLYVTMGVNAPVSRLDAKTGKTVAVYEATRNAAELIVVDGVLLAAIDKTDVKGLRQQDSDRNRSTAASRGNVARQGQAIIAIDLSNGKTLWQSKPGAVHMTMAADNGHVVYAQQDKTVCRSLKDGKLLWQTAGKARSLVIHKNVVLTATFPKRSIVELKASDIADGKTLWSRSGTHLPSFTMFHIPASIFVVDDVVWALGDRLEWKKSGGRGTMLGLHYKTGEPVHDISAEGAFGAGHHQRCYPSKATENYIMTGKRGTEMFGLKPGDEPLKYQWVRGVCRYGILPCNGLIYAPSHSCVCSPGAQLTGFNALAPQAGSVDYPLTAGNAQPGPAYGHWCKEDEPDDWPTYRADNMRRGMSPTVLPQKFAVQWESDFGGRISPPVQADGRVYVSVMDKHNIAALDSSTGKTLWSYHGGGRIDSPPTLHKGLVIFGCRDGWVTALRDTDGEIVWRFRAAPADRRLVARDQLESVWPVMGSVLVANDIVYVTAGRSLFLDGGLYMYGLEARTGKVRYKERLKPLDENTDKTMKVSTAHMSGAAPRILQADAEQIYMGHVMFDHELRLPGVPGEAMYTKTARGSERIFPYSGFLDDSGYNRVFWSFRNAYSKYPQDLGRGQLMVQDGNNLYGIRYFWGRGWNSPVFKAGEGYVLFELKADDPIKKSDGPHNLALDHYMWHTNIPIRVNAMVAARMGGPAEAVPCLAVAGAPDVVDAKDPLAAFEGRKGAVLQLHDAATGKQQQKMMLKSPPVFDGMIAAEGALIISSESGTLIKIGD